MWLYTVVLIQSNKQYSMPRSINLAIILLGIGFSTSRFSECFLRSAYHIFDVAYYWVVLISKPWWKLSSNIIQKIMGIWFRNRLRREPHKSNWPQYILTLDIDDGDSPTYIFGTQRQGNISSIPINFYFWLTQ